MNDLSPEASSVTNDLTESATTPRSPVTYLHIGTMKSGTSYLQDVLSRNTAPLAEDDIDYLGRGTRAVWDILELRESVAKDLSGAWTRLARQTRNSSASLRLLSMEMLSTAGPTEVEAIVASLDTVKVVVTARDLARTIPSAWQNVVKHGSAKSFESFVSDLIADSPSRTQERFWRQHDLATIVTRWADVVGPEQVSIVTVPPSGAPPTLLWERFCSVLGTDPRRYDASARQTSNFSLPYSDAELLRKINARLGGALTNEAYNRYVRSFLANEIMRPAPEATQTDEAGRAAGSRPDTPSLGQVGRSWAVERAERITEEVRRSGVNVVGNLADLVPTPIDAASNLDPATPPRVEYPDTAVRVMAQLIRKISDVDPDLAGGSSAADNRPEARRAKRAPGRAAGRNRAGARRDATGGRR